MRRLNSDEDGTILVFVAIALAVLLGMVALSFDLGRMAATQTELQSFADNVALAAAGELDGNADALTRAEAAATAMITDTQTFGAGDRVLDRSDFDLTYFSTLGNEALGQSDIVAANPRAARFVRVDVHAYTIQMGFASAFSAMTGRTPPNPNVAASAVAGFTQVACQVTPLMFCLPSPTFKADEHKGEVIDLRTARQGAAWGPGDFGFLDPDQIPSSTCVGVKGDPKHDACIISGINSVTQCFDMRGVDTVPGQRNGIENAIFNVRFDMYQAILNSAQNDPMFAPAPNVIKGRVPNAGGGSTDKTSANGNGGSSGGGPVCINNAMDASPNTGELPIDDCMTNGSCGRFGDGNWTTGRRTYVTWNYNNNDPHRSVATRYDYYLAELSAHGGPGSSTPILASTDARTGTDRWTTQGNGQNATVRALTETGRPICSSNQSSDPERRVIIAAGVDCAANPISGRTTGVPVKEFFRIFLIQPVRDSSVNPPEFDIYGEIIGSAGGNGSSATDQFRDVVQLYR